MSIEQPQKNVENPERRRYEYKDATGKKIADVEAEFLASGDMVDDPASGEVVVARRLASLKLTNPEDGRVFDVLAAFNGKKVDVIVPEKRIGNSTAPSPMDASVVVPSPESPLDLATLLHELGHVEQHDDPEIMGMSEVAGTVRPYFAEDPVAAYRKNLSADGRTPSDEEVFRTAKKMRTLAALKRELPEETLQGYAGDIAAYEAATDLEALRGPAKALRELFALPLRMAERDATRRALQGLRRIREEAGIDLLSKTLNPKEALASEAEGCEAATVEGVEDPDAYVKVSTVAAMKGDLKTYGAEKFRIRK